MKELRKLRERYDFSFDSRQLGLVLLSVAAVAALVFVLGISVGRQWERKIAMARPGAPAKAMPPKPKPASQPVVAPAAPAVVQPVLRPSTTVAARAAKVKENVKTEPEDLTFPKVLTSSSKKTAPLAKEEPSKTKKTAPPAKEEPSKTKKTAPPVKEEPPGTKKTMSLSGEEPAGAGFTVQAGAYKTRAAAQASADRLKKKGYEARVFDSGAQGGPYHFKLRVGRYPSKEAAKAVARKLKAENLTPFVTREE